VSAATLGIAPRECLVQMGSRLEANAALFLDNTEFADRRLKVRLLAYSVFARILIGPRVQISLSDATLPDDLPLLPIAPVLPIVLPNAPSAAATAAAPGQIPLLPTVPFAAAAALPRPVAPTVPAPAAMNPVLANAVASPGLVLNSTDQMRVDEVARTVYVGNIAPSVQELELLNFFSKAGPIAYLKMAGMDRSTGK